jgi:hypothetical protein
MKLIQTVKRSTTNVAHQVELFVMHIGFSFLQNLKEMFHLLSHFLDFNTKSMFSALNI